MTVRNKTPEFEQYRPQEPDLKPQSPIVSVTDGVSEVQEGYLQSPGFKSGVNGWRLDGDGTLEAKDGVFSGEIYVPNKTSPQFSVDVLGNIVARSLRRKDFHWFTFFESTDGYQNNSTGTGTVSISRSGVTLSSGATSNSKGWITKGPTNASNFFSWSKGRSCKIIVSFLDTASNQYGMIAMGDVTDVSAVNEHVGFFLSGNTLYGHQADGTTNAYSALQTIVAGTVYSLEAVFTPSVGVTYYVDGVLKATITTNYPGPSANFSYQPLDVYIQNAAALDKRMLITMFDFWQAN